MQIVLDNIVFSLQKSGGISVFWSEHIKRIISQKNISITFIEYENSKENLSRRSIYLETTQRKKIFLNFKRYINPYLKIKVPYIFHSSYYRVSHDDFVKNITTIHDFTYEYYARGIAKYVHSIQKKHAILCSEKIICISENTKKDLFRFFPHIYPEKVCVIYNGVSEDFYPLTVESELKCQFGKYNYLLFIGARKEYKNFSMVVEAARLAKLPLVIVGGGNLTQAEKEYLDKVLGCNYCHSGFIDNKQLNILYNNAFCLLYPSSYEGFGIPVIEAQKAGCPVIANYNSSIPEIIGDTKIKLEKINANIIVEAIKMLTSSTREYEKKQGLINAKRFSWDITFQKTMQLYKSIAV